MKKLVLIISLLIPLFFSPVKLNVITASEETEESSKCNNLQENAVKIVNNYDIFKGNGFVYKVDGTSNYIITTSKIISEVNSFKIIYQNNVYEEASLLGYDKNNEVAVFKTKKTGNLNNICFANSKYLYNGQRIYLYGYSDLNTKLNYNTYINKSKELSKLTAL